MQKAILVCGSPGAGKSTYAQHLARGRKAVLLDIDTVTQRLVQTALAAAGHNPDDRDSQYFKETYRDVIYETLFDAAKENLQIQDTVVVGPFTKEIRRANWPEQLSDRLGRPVEVHYVGCPADVRRERLSQRGDARDDAKVKDWQNFIQYYGDEAAPCFEHTLIDGTDPIYL